MLIGNYSQKFTAKGRTAIPKKFRDQLGDQLVLLQGYEGCLMLVPADQLEQIIPNDQPFAMSAARNTNRFLLGNAFEVEPDSQGRFVIPVPLRDYAQIQSDHVLFVGVGNRVEMWEPKKWQDHQTYLIQNSSQLAEQLVPQNDRRN